MRGERCWWLPPPLHTRSLPAARLKTRRQSLCEFVCFFKNCNPLQTNKWACTTSAVELSVGIITSQFLKLFENLAHKVKMNIKPTRYLIPFLSAVQLCSSLLVGHMRMLVFLHYINKRINERTILVLTQSSYFCVCELFSLCMRYKHFVLMFCKVTSTFLKEYEYRCSFQEVDVQISSFRLNVKLSMFSPPCFNGELAYFYLFLIYFIF